MSFPIRPRHPGLARVPATHGWSLRSRVLRRIAVGLTAAAVMAGVPVLVGGAGLSGAYAAPAAASAKASPSAKATGSEAASVTSVFAVAATLPVLTVGSQGPAVARLQRIVGVSDDGAFGPRTEAALVALQRRKGVPGPRGKVVEQTWRHLLVIEAHQQRLAAIRAAKGRPRLLAPLLPELQIGQAGRQVRRVQKILGMSLKDGIFGPMTKASVEDFQRSRGFATITGRVGEPTWRALLNYQKQEVKRAARIQDQPSGGSTVSTSGSGSLGSRAAAWALDHIGDRYVAASGQGWDPGEPEPGAWDCSSFTYAAYRAAGLSWSFGISYMQYMDRQHVRLVPLSQARTGDLIFFNHDGGESAGNPVDHVGIIVDPDSQSFVHAQSSKNGVVESSYAEGTYYGDAVGAPDSRGIPTGSAVVGRITS